MEPMEVADVTEASSTSGDVARSALASPDAAVDAALATASSEKYNLLDAAVDEMEVPCGLRGGHLPRSSLAIPWALLRPLLRIKSSFATTTKGSST